MRIVRAGIRNMKSTRRFEKRPLTTSSFEVDPVQDLGVRHVLARRRCCLDDLQELVDDPDEHPARQEEEERPDDPGDRREDLCARISRRTRATILLMRRSGRRGTA